MKALGAIWRKRNGKTPMHRTRILLAGLLLLLPSTVLAESALERCEDQLRGVRVYAERLGKSKQADDLDAAQTIAGLIKQIEALRAEAAAVRDAHQKAEQSKGTQVPEAAPRGAR